MPERVDGAPDLVEELDFRIGQILDALKKTGKEKNTIVLFTSDNGRQPGQSGPNDEPPWAPAPESISRNHPSRPATSGAGG